MYSTTSFGSAITAAAMRVSVNVSVSVRASISVRVMAIVSVCVSDRVRVTLQTCHA